MRIQVTARHVHVPDSVRRRAEERFGRLDRFDPRLSAVEVVFDEEKHVRRVEGILHIDGSGTIVATAEGTDFRDALDRLVDKLSRRLRRRRERVRDHQGPSLKEAAGE